MRIRRHIAACGLALLLARSAAAQTPRLASPQLSRQLDAPVTIAWEGQQLGAALARLAEVHALPLWIDRRVDRGAPLDLAVDAQPIRVALDRLVASQAAARWGWSTLSDVVYFGPHDSARDLATCAARLRDAMAQAPAAVRRAWLAPAPWEFPRLSVPRDLLRETVASQGGALANADAMPHDVWAAGSLPAVAPIDRALLLTIGFDLVVEPSPDARRWTLRPVEGPATIERDYAVNDRLETALTALAAADPQVIVRRRGRRVAVIGRWEDHEMLRRALRGQAAEEPPPRERPAPRGAQRFTLAIENQPVGRVLEQLAAQLGLTIAWEPQLAAAAPPVAQRLVSCDVRQVDLDGLLAAILEPVGLAFDRDGQNVTIRSSQ